MALSKPVTGDEEIVCSDSSASLLTELEVCARCTRQMVEPRMLACLHVFCSKCIDQMQKGIEVGTDDIEDSDFKIEANPEFTDNVHCPRCHTEVEIPGGNLDLLPTPSYLVHLKAHLEKKDGKPKTCDLCEEGSPVAVVYCPSCAAYMCADCRKAHARIPTSRHHETNDLSDGDMGMGEKHMSVCPEHKDLQRLFCRTCNRVICNSCKGTRHLCCKSVSIEMEISGEETALKQGRAEPFETFAKNNEKRVKDLHKLLSLELTLSTELVTKEEQILKFGNKTEKLLLLKALRRRLQSQEPVTIQLTQGSLFYEPNYKPFKGSHQLCRPTAGLSLDEMGDYIDKGTLVYPGRDFPYQNNPNISSNDVGVVSSSHNAFDRFFVYFMSSKQNYTAYNSYCTMKRGGPYHLTLAQDYVPYK